VAAIEYQVNGDSHGHLLALAALYAEVFAEPPHNEEARHVRRFHRIRPIVASR
jgi:hypothetical protein